MNAILQSTVESLVGFGEVMKSTSALDSLDDVDRGQVQQHFPHQLQGQPVQNHCSLKRTQIHQETRVFIANIEKQRNFIWPRAKELKELGEKRIIANS